MAARDQIIDELDRLLDAGPFRDYCPNGLQVEGRSEIARVATGVSGSAALLRQAPALGTDRVPTPHGLFWEGDDPRVIGSLRKRLGLLMGADVSLAAYHLPLDAHASMGNNALIAAGIGAALDEPFGLAAGRPVGWSAHFDDDGIAPQELGRRGATQEGGGARPRLADAERAHRRPRVSRAQSPYAASASSPAAALSSSASQSPRGSTRLSPASRPSRVVRWRARRASISSPRATTRPRLSACGRSASTWQCASASSTATSRSRTRSERVTASEPALDRVRRWVYTYSFVTKRGGSTDGESPDAHGARA